MLTNEELALMIQQGDRDAAGELWEQTYRLIHKLLGKYYPLCARFGIEPEDLTQSAYFALVRAVDAYNPDKGYAFTSYLNLHISNAAREALGFRGTGRTIPPPLVKSLDEPLPGTEDASFTLGDTIEDENAAAMFEQIQENWQRSQLRTCLDSCIATMPPDQAATLRARYYEGKTLKATADATGCNLEAVRRLEEKALRHMRKPQHTRWLRPFIESADCTGYGLTAFKNRGYVSRVEVLAGAW